jgi:hypothetical protein
VVEFKFLWITFLITRTREGLIRFVYILRFFYNHYTRMKVYVDFIDVCSRVKEIIIQSKVYTAFPGIKRSHNY